MGNRRILTCSEKLLDPERMCWNGGFLFVAGVDEAGRGPLAGPVVAGAVIFPAFPVDLPPVNDSKQLSDHARRELRDRIVAFPGVRYALAEVDAGEIDRINILRATHLAMRNAVEKLGEPVDFVLIDGNPVKGLPWQNRSIVKGDAKSASIAAASILAKVHRDELMERYAELYPQYGFAEHKGYGTAAHLEALRRYGACELHRRSFAPVREVLNPPDFEQIDLDFEEKN